MPVVTVARYFHWEMGHRLPFHKSGCQNIHGHSYRLWVSVEGETDANGMVIDFADLKDIVDPIIAPFDHAFVCDDGDEIMKTFLSNAGFRMVVVPFHSTAENLASHLLELIWNQLSANPRIQSIQLRLHETENAFAEVSRVR